MIWSHGCTASMGLVLVVHWDLEPSDDSGGRGGIWVAGSNGIFHIDMK